MKRWMCICTVVLAVVALATCALNPRADAESEWAAVQEEAAGRTAAIVSLAAEAIVTGSAEQVCALAEAEDSSGLLSQILEPAVAPPEVTALTELPPYGSLPDATDFADGDVLVFASAGDTIQNAIMSLILVNPVYSHAGIVDGDRIALLDPSFVVSATIDFDGLEIINGLCYQDIEDLFAHSAIVTRLRYDAGSTGPVGAALDSFVDTVLPTSTTYAFVNAFLRPIGRYDMSRWYCSKVPWFVYDAAGYDIEGEWFYGLGDPGGRWTEQRESVLYSLYMRYVEILTPDWLERWLYRRNPNWLTEAADRYVASSLTELISPDELRAYAPVDPQVTMASWSRVGIQEPPIFVLP